MLSCNHLDQAAAEYNLDITIGRRRFVKLCALGGGAVAFLHALPRPAFAGKADALLLSCMDYRLIDDLVRFMDDRELTNKYDHVILAGASAGAFLEKFKDWHETFWSHLKLAIDLHAIHKVMIVDHCDCGAYKLALGPDHAKDAETERRAHAEILGGLAGQIRKRYPRLGVETYLMALDGTVEEI